MLKNFPYFNILKYYHSATIFHWELAFALTQYLSEKPSVWCRSCQTASLIRKYRPFLSLSLSSFFSYHVSFSQCLLRPVAGLNERWHQLVGFLKIFYFQSLATKNKFNYTTYEVRCSLMTLYVKFKFPKISCDKTMTKSLRQGRKPSIQVPGAV
jgi:hypothetical protein